MCGRCSQCKDNCRNCCKKVYNNLRTVLLLIGVAVGIGLGIFLRNIPPFDKPKLHPREMMYLKFPGELMLRSLTALSVPLLMSSLISGLGNLDSKTSGKIAIWTLLYYLGTTTLAVGEGIAWIMAIKPGANVTMQGNKTSSRTATENVDALLDMFRNLLPDNLLKSTFVRVRTEIKSLDFVINETSGATINLENFELKEMSGINVMGLTFFSILLGVVMAKMRPTTKTLFDVFEGLFVAIMKLVLGMLWIYPICIAMILAGTIVELEDPINHVIAMGMFLMTVFVALFCHAFIVMPLLYVICTRNNPFKLMKGVSSAIFTAMVTQNSNITMPVTVDCLENNLHIHPKVTRFMCPIGATVNMDGFALYEAIAVIFIALLRGLEFGIVNILIMAFTAIAISIGAPSAGNGLVLYAILFQSVNLPVEDIFLLIPFDWFLTSFRTAINVWGDCVGCGIIYHHSKYQLQGIPYDNTNNNDVNTPFDDGKPLISAPVTPQNPERKNYTVKMENETGDIMVVSRL